MIQKLKDEMQVSNFSVLSEKLFVCDQLLDLEFLLVSGDVP